MLGISTAGTVTLSNGTSVGSIVSVGGNAIGTISSDGNGGDDLVISFENSDANPARITTLIRALTYANLNIEPSTLTRTISIDSRRRRRRQRQRDRPGHCRRRQ